ncbi:MAG: hypothetical protein A2W75_02760 [Nitrospinae bacterium RIFCSPLOWO2_12_39_15]|nr:MAG: hypothetical protein A2W75_02760 [Nitrospinae bacterium RIFCSPLOWO2_12_39_15]
MINFALKYIERGWSVFPCIEKKPLTTHGYKDATSDPEVAKQKFSNNPNIGIATGKVSDIFVLDVDVKDGKNGDDVLAKLESENGDLPNTIESLTCSGGRHIYFKYPKTKIIGCKTDILRGLDIRGDGGYVIAPPSVANGKSYEWEVSHHPDETTIADAPDWLLDLIISPRPHIDLSKESEKIVKNRNDTLMRIGMNLRRLGLEAKNIESVLQNINDTRCTPPLSKKEVSTISQSVAKYATKDINSPLTEMWNAELFLDQYSENIRYCPLLGGWFVWDGRRWGQDDTMQIEKFSKTVIKQMIEIGRNSDNKTLIKHAIKSQRAHDMKAMLDIAKSDVAISPTSFDTDSMLLNFKNGTFDLESGVLSAHDRDKNITKLIEQDYDAAAQCPVWNNFLDTVFSGDKELISYMQRVIGYSLTGEVSEQCIFILYGFGMNGKSTFLKHIYRILGDYAINTPSTTLMEKFNEGIPNDLARLKGTRFVTSSETGKGRKLAESKIKQMTGDDPISARFLHKEYFDFMPTFKIFLSTNYKPHISGTDTGIWRRIRTIPFEKVITEQERDISLDSKITAEYAGIINWAIEGFKKWKEGGLKTASKILDKTKEYKEDSDVIGIFLDEKCVKGEGLILSTSETLRSIQEWSKENGITSVKRHEFLEYMNRMGYEKVRSGEDGRIYFKGIGLKKTDLVSDYESPF